MWKNGLLSLRKKDDLSLKSPPPCLNSVRQYTGVTKQDLVPVYTMRALSERKTKTVHRNMMMKLNDLPIDTFGQKPVVRKRKKPVKRPVHIPANADFGGPVAGDV